MPIKMTQQQIAEWILEILVEELKLKPGDRLPDQLLKERYRARKGDSGDIKIGLELATELEWLTLDEFAPTQFRLTKLGYESFS